MNKENILGFPLYRFYYSEDKVKKVEEEVSKLEWVLNPPVNPSNWMWKGVYEDRNLHELSEFDELFNWIQECLDEVKRDLNLTCDSLKIISSWANLNKMGESFHDHVHPNAFMSSNYYVSGGEGTYTVWHTLNPFFDQTNIYPIDEGTDLYHYEPTEPGKLVIFPPQVYHYSTPNISDKERITIAANIFPEGKIKRGSVSKMKIRVH